MRKTDQEIVTYMNERYGDSFLYKPPARPRTWLLWAAPLLFLVGGGIAAAVVISRKSKLPETAPKVTVTPRNQLVPGTPYIRMIVST